MNPNIDWNLLKQQKETLFRIIRDADNLLKAGRTAAAVNVDALELEHLDGILHLLDAVQDELQPGGAVASGAATVPREPWL